MKDVDARINRVLEGLHGAEPADGLEQRVLRAVRERRSVEIRSSRGRFRHLFPPAPQWYAVAIPTLVLLLVLGSIGRQRSQQRTGRARAGIARSVAPEIVPHLSPPTHLAAAQPISPLGRRPERELRARRVQTARGQRLDVATLRNHPAPEQPLTGEERLLLRLAHRAAPEKFDVLNPDARDAQARADKAEFRKFFGPPPTGDSE